MFVPSYRELWNFTRETKVRLFASLFDCKSFLRFVDVENFFGGKFRLFPQLNQQEYAILTKKPVYTLVLHRNSIFVQVLTLDCSNSIS